MARQILIAALISTIFLSGLIDNARADDDWAPGIDAPASRKRDSGNSALWLRAGLSRAQFGPKGVGMYGLDLEAALRLVASGPDASALLALELPLVLTGHAATGQSGSVLTAQIIPTVKVTFDSRQSNSMSLMIGYGGGRAMLSGSESHDGNLPLVSLRAGLEVMFSKTVGVNMRYTQMTMRTRTWWRKVNLSFNQFAVSLVYHP